MGFENVFTHGDLVDINVSMWTAEKRLTPQDLGIDEEKLSEVFTLGRKQLMPKDVISRFKHLDYKARATLYNNSFPCKFGQSRFIPKKKLIDFVDEFEAVKKEFQEEVNKFVERYESYKNDMRDEYVKAAHEAYQRSSLLCGLVKSEDTFVREFLERVDSFYPHTEQIRSKFHMDYLAFQARMPDLSQVSFEEIAEDNAKRELMQKAFEKKLYNHACSLVDTMVGSLREKATTVLSQVMDSIKEGKRINEATFNMIRKMIEDFEKMNVCEDSILETKLVEFKSKYLDAINAKMVRENDELRDELYKELKELVEVASDEAAIKTLAENYRKEINL